MLRTRILTALVLCIVIFGALAQSDPLYFSVVLGLMLLSGAWEWSGFIRGATRPLRIVYVLLIVAGCVAARQLLWTPELFLWLLRVAVVWWLVASFCVLGAPARVAGSSAALAGFFVLIPSLASLLRVVNDWQDGARDVLLIVGVPVLMDTGGYFAGRAFGRHKLAPRVSPGKTWEGLYGGLLLLALCAWALSFWLPYARWPFVGVALLGGGFSVVGDLTESLLKRANHLKDSGRLLPGHGGVLDRIDSITAAAPVMTLGLIWLGAGA